MKKMPYGLRKYLRREKARIRKVEKISTKRTELIGEVYKKIFRRSFAK